MKYLPTFIVENIPLCVVLFAISVGIIFYLASCLFQKRRIHPIPATIFLHHWNEFRQSDTSGCYIILIYKRRPSKKLLKTQRGYSDVYVGQSVNMYKRVFNHLTGHGNGDVYADMKYKKHVFVAFMPCSTQELNALEIELISKYNATESYNRTKGGAKLTHR